MEQGSPQPSESPEAEVHSQELLLVNAASPGSSSEVRGSERRQVSPLARALLEEDPAPYKRAGNGAAPFEGTSLSFS